MVLIILHRQTKLSDSTNHESIESIQDYHEQKESSIKWSILDLKTEILGRAKLTIERKTKLFQMFFFIVTVLGRLKFLGRLKTV